MINMCHVIKELVFVSLHVKFLMNNSYVAIKSTECVFLCTSIVSKVHVILFILVSAY